MQEEILKRGAWCFTKDFTLKHYPELYDIIINWSGRSWVEKLYLYAHNMNEIPKCKMCSNIVSFKNFISGHSTYCSSRCVMQDPESIEKIKETSLERFGTTNIFSSEKFKEDQKKRNLELYGVEHFTQTEEMKEKSKETNLKKYGVEHVLQNKELLEKSKQTCKKHFGCEFALQNPEIQERIKQNNLDKYGVEYFTQTEEMKEKSKETWIENYGVDNPSKSSEIKKKKEETFMEHFGVVLKKCLIIYKIAYKIVKDLKEALLEATDSYEYEKYISSDIIKDMMITDFVQQGRFNQLIIVNRKDLSEPVWISSQKELDDIIKWYNKTTYKKDRLNLQYIFKEGIVFDFTNIRESEIDFHGINILGVPSSDNEIRFKVSSKLTIKNALIDCYNLILESEAEEGEAELIFDKTCKVHANRLYLDNVGANWGTKNLSAEKYF